jgi:hypothetical protein
VSPKQKEAKKVKICKIRFNSVSLPWGIGQVVVSFLVQGDRAQSCTDKNRQSLFFFSHPCGQTTILLVEFDNMQRVLIDFGKSIPCNIYKVEFSFHIFGHANCVACKLLPNVLLESGPLPPSHLLNLRVQVTSQD